MAFKSLLGCFLGQQWALAMQHPVYSGSFGLILPRFAPVFGGFSRFLVAANRGLTPLKPLILLGLVKQKHSIPVVWYVFGRFTPLDNLQIRDSIHIVEIRLADFYARQEASQPASSTPQHPRFTSNRK